MTTLKTKFNLGQKVWRVTRDIQSIELPCRACRGRGHLKATGADGQARMVKCPECGVSATVTLGAWPQWRVEGPLQVGAIKLQVYDRSAEGNDEEVENLNPAPIEVENLNPAPIEVENLNPALMDRPDEESYMAWSTGVGSGTIHYVEDLFASEEEAKEEAIGRTDRARRGKHPGGRKSDTAVWWPSVEQVRIAAGFLDHRDIYEHDIAHVALAEVIVATARAREEAGR